MTKKTTANNTHMLMLAMSKIVLCASSLGRQICDLAVGVKKYNRQIADLASCKGLTFSLRSFARHMRSRCLQANHIHNSMFTK